MDLFPGIKVPFVDYGKLQTAIEKTLDSLSLQRMATFITKVNNKIIFYSLYICICLRLLKISS